MSAIRSAAYALKHLDSYKIAKEASFKLPCVILMNPFLDANVGSVSRAMLNFGMHDLRVINPECDIHSEAAKTLAMSGFRVLENAKVFSSLEDCIADLDKLVVTTARRRDLTNTVNTPRKAMETLINSENELKIGLMFGRERNGLTNEEIAYGDICVEIPAFSGYSSLNLAQAVNIMGYECWLRALEVQRSMKVSKAPPPERKAAGQPRKEQFNAFFNRLESKLDRKVQMSIDRRASMSVDSDSGSNEVVASSLNEHSFGTEDESKSSDKVQREFTSTVKNNIRNIFQRANLTSGEIQLMHRIIHTLDT